MLIGLIAFSISLFQGELSGSFLHGAAIGAMVLVGSLFILTAVQREWQLRRATRAIGGRKRWILPVIGGVILLGCALFGSLILTPIVRESLSIEQGLRSDRDTAELGVRSVNLKADENFNYVTTVITNRTREQLHISRMLLEITHIDPMQCSGAEYTVFDLSDQFTVDSRGANGNVRLGSGFANGFLVPGGAHMDYFCEDRTLSISIDPSLTPDPGDSISVGWRIPRRVTGVQAPQVGPARQLDMCFDAPMAASVSVSAMGHDGVATGSVSHGDTVHRSASDPSESPLHC